MDIFAKLTERQRDVFDFIADSIQTRGYGPTVREIADQFDIASPNGVVCHLHALEKKGLITREENRSRAIQLTDEAHNAVVGLPHIALDEASSLRDALASSTCRLDLAGMFDNEKGNLFTIKVEGNMLVDEQIVAGDMIILRKARSAKANAVVLAANDEGEAVLCRWVPEKSKKRVKLEPANKRMKPTYAKNAKVLAVVTGVVRAI
jgi:repressor LexA